LEQVNAQSIVSTSGFITLLFVILTLLSFPAWWAEAFKVSNQILAAATIPAGRRSTIINIGLAELADITIPALAFISILKI